MRVGVRVRVRVRVLLSKKEGRALCSTPEREDVAVLDRPLVPLEQPRLALRAHVLLGALAVEGLHADQVELGLGEG